MATKGEEGSKIPTWFMDDPLVYLRRGLIDMSVLDSFFKSLIKPLVQYPTLEIFLEVDEGFEPLWSISRTGHLIRDFIRSLKWEPGTNLKSVLSKSPLIKICLELCYARTFNSCSWKSLHAVMCNSKHMYGPILLEVPKWHFLLFTST